MKLKEVTFGGLQAQAPSTAAGMAKIEAQVRGLAEMRDRLGKDGLSLVFGRSHVGMVFPYPCADGFGLASEVVPTHAGAVHSVTVKTLHSGLSTLDDVLRSLRLDIAQRETAINEHTVSATHPLLAGDIALLQDYDNWICFQVAVSRAKAAGATDAEAFASADAARNGILTERKKALQSVATAA